MTQASSSCTRRGNRIWTGAVTLDADFVVAVGLMLQKGGRLTAASVAKLDGYTAAMLQADVNDA